MHRRRRFFASPLPPLAHATHLVLPTGSGNSLAFQDLSGQDLRKNKYIKADLRGTILRWVGGMGRRGRGSCVLRMLLLMSTLHRADLRGTVLRRVKGASGRGGTMQCKHQGAQSGQACGAVHCNASVLSLAFSPAAAPTWRA